LKGLFSAQFAASSTGRLRLALTLQSDQRPEDGSDKDTKNDFLI
jgi:hypothetical protein